MVASLRRFATPGRVAIALIVANEIRGLLVVSAIVTAWWKAHH